MSPTRRRGQDTRHPILARVITTGLKQRACASKAEAQADTPSPEQLPCTAHLLCTVSSAIQ
eukprot:14892150-Alexandrium_andersonii.AAC.1